MRFLILIVSPSQSPHAPSSLQGSTFEPPEPGSSAILGGAVLSFESMFFSTIIKVCFVLTQGCYDISQIHCQTSRFSWLFQFKNVLNDFLITLYKTIPFKEIDCGFKKFFQVFFKQKVGYHKFLFKW